MERSVFVAYRGEDAMGGHWGVIGHLDYVDDQYRFLYTHGARKLPGFQPFPGMERLDRMYLSKRLFPVFANRLLNTSRPEYDDYLQWCDFDAQHPPEPIAILAVTGGRRATDRLEVFPPPEVDEAGRFHSVFFLHGIRWTTSEAREHLNGMHPDDSLAIRCEDDNPADPDAVAVYDPAQPDLSLGYLPRYLAHDIRQIEAQEDGDIQLSVVRVNPDAPMQQQLLCRLHAQSSQTMPCSGDEFQTIVALPEITAA